MIFETHTHLYFPSFDADRDAVMQECRDAGVAHQVQISCDEISCLAAIDMAQKYPECFATVGLHPCDVSQIGNPQPHRYSGFETYETQCQDLDQLMAFFDQKIADHPDLIVGIGETGLDAYHVDTPAELQSQIESWKAHVQLAEKHSLPQIIHTRNARAATLDFFAQNINPDRHRGVIHCFCEDADFAQIMTEKYGFSLGIGGVPTYNKTDGIKEAIAQTPIEFLVTETDAPFLTPNNFRKKGTKRNQPSFIPEMIDLIADLKSMDRDEVESILFENGKRLFGV